MQDAPDRIEQSVHQDDRAGQGVRHRQGQRRRAPDELHALVQEHDDPERRDDLIQVVAIVEVAQDGELEQQPERQRGPSASTTASRKCPVTRIERHRQIGAEHVLHAVRQVDEVHHAERRA